MRVPKGAEGFRHHGAGILTPHDTATAWRVEGAHDCLILAFPFEATNATLQELLPRGANSLYRLSDRVIRDPVTAAIAKQLWAQGEDPIGQFFADHAVSLVLGQLARHASGPGRREGPNEHLTARTLARAKDYLRSNLSRDLSLGEVAAAVGLSPYHFLRAFKASTGRTPFQWLQDERIKVASRLLSSSDVPLAQVALEVGFKTQSHFTSVFRRALGQTPARWRAEYRR